MTLGKEVLEYMLEPHVVKETEEHFRRVAVKKTINRLYHRGLLLKSTPVVVRFGDRNKRTCFYLNEGSSKCRRGVCFVPQVEKSVKFYKMETWERKFIHGKTKVTQDEVLAYAKQHGAFTATELTEHLGVNPRLVSGMLFRMVREGRLLRRGKINRFGVEVKLGRIGYVYGLDYDMMTKKLNELKESKRLFPSLARFIKRVTADSRVGELTAEMIFRSAPFNFSSVSLANISKYVDDGDDFKPFYVGVYKWFYNEKLIMKVLTPDQLEKKKEELAKGIDKMFNARLLSGIALEDLVGEAFYRSKDFSHAKMRIYIPHYNKYGREIDYVGLSRFSFTHQKVKPTIYVCEIKYKQVPAKDVRTFYEKIRHTCLLKLGEKVVVSLAEKAPYPFERDAEMPVWTLKGNVVPIFVGAGFTKQALETCKQLGIIWIYANDLLEFLGRKTRRRIYTERVARIIEQWVKEAKGKVRVGKMSEIREKVRGVLHQKLGITFHA